MQQSSIDYLPNDHLLLRFQSPRWVQHLMKVLWVIFFVLLLAFIWEFVVLESFFCLIGAILLFIFLGVKTLIYDKIQVVEITPTHIYSKEIRSFHKKPISKRLFLHQLKSIKHPVFNQSLVLIAKDRTRIVMGPFRSEKQRKFIENRCLRMKENLLA